MRSALREEIIAAGGQAAEGGEWGVLGKGIGRDLMSGF